MTPLRVAAAPPRHMEAGMLITGGGIPETLGAHLRALNDARVALSV
jgi:hypothetical protein